MRASGDLTLIANRDLTVRGSTLDAGGDLTGLAGRELGLLAGVDQRETRYAFGHALAPGEKGVYAEGQSYTLTPTASRLQGRNIALAADTLYSEGASLRATQDIDLLARTIVLDAAHRLANVSASYSNIGSHGQQQVQGQQVIDSATGTVVDAGRNLSVKSRGDTTLIGSALAAGQEMRIEVGGDLALLAAPSTRRAELNASGSTSKSATKLAYSEQELRQLLSTISVGNKLTIDVKGDLTAHVGEKNSAGALQADRMTATGIERGDSRQQVSVTRSGVGATANPTQSQVLGDLAARGIRNGANDRTQRGQLRIFYCLSFSWQCPLGVMPIT